MENDQQPVEEHLTPTTSRTELVIALDEDDSEQTKDDNDVSREGERDENTQMEYTDEDIEAAGTLDDVIETESGGRMLIDEEDEEAEFCMIIEELTNEVVEKEARSEKSVSEDVAYIGERNILDEEEPKEVIDIEDDKSEEDLHQSTGENVRHLEDECLILAEIPNSKSNTQSTPETSSYLRPSIARLWCSSLSSPRPRTSAESFIPLYVPTSRTSSSSESDLEEPIVIRTASEYADDIQARNALREASTSKASSPAKVEEPQPSTSQGFSRISQDKQSLVSPEDIETISEIVNMKAPIVRNVLNLVEDECTIPFIARYRQSFVKGIDAEKIRQITTAYEQLKEARKKAQEVEKMLRKQGRFNSSLKNALNRCKTTYAVEQLYKLCCNESDDCIRAKNFGLEDSAKDILEGKNHDPNRFVGQYSSALDTTESVIRGWQSIIVDIVSKDCNILDLLIESCKKFVPLIEVKINLEICEELRENNNKELVEKYKHFNNFKQRIDKISCHCLMAIERGEKAGILLVYIEFHEEIYRKLVTYCTRVKWPRAAPPFLLECIKVAWSNYLKPDIARFLRWELKNLAHLKALEVFRENVKYLLLEPPLRGESVLGVDPGLGSGCKMAVVSPWGVYMTHEIVYIDDDHQWNEAAIAIKNLLNTYECSIIALGNGTGCRKFETLLVQRINLGYFQPLNLRYKIIPESGVSWYSISEAAKHEFRECKLPPSIIGAVTIARRLQDPLSELVKVDPKRLEVGMYMKDVDEKAVKDAFHDVCVECVSFCGVDVNVASYDLLSKVSGLGPELARKICEKRQRGFTFTSRSQLKSIEDLGEKQFEQCAGFIKIMPSTRSLEAMTNKAFVGNKRFLLDTDLYDPLDSTVIHPESYRSAETFLLLIESEKSEIGKQSLCKKIESYLSNSLPLEDVAELCHTNVTNMRFIVESLKQQNDYDYRKKFEAIYMSKVMSFASIRLGTILRGRVMNVTPMGAFVDCGISDQRNSVKGFVMASECHKRKLHPNQIVEVKVVKIDKQRHRFSVAIQRIIS